MSLPATIPAPPISIAGFKDVYRVPRVEAAVWASEQGLRAAA